MPNTYSQIYIQIVFAVEGRQNLISPRHREELHKYITGIISKRKQKLLAIFCMPDHIHLLVGISPAIAISDLVRDIKSGSSNFINEKKWIRGRFNWQEGFGAFSYSRSQIKAVGDYILEQESRHQDRTFKNEYVGLLKKFDVNFGICSILSTDRSLLRSSILIYLGMLQTDRPSGAQQPAQCF